MKIQNLTTAIDEWAFSTKRWKEGAGNPQWLDRFSTYSRFLADRQEGGDRNA